MKSINLLFATTALVAAALPHAAAANSEEAQKQATRLISQAIADRIGETNAPEPGAPALDAGSRSAWGLLSTTQLDFSGGGGGEMDLYLGTAGFDGKVSEKALIGISASYYTIDGPFESDALSISPYFGYIVNDHFFWSGLAAVSFTDSSSIAGVGGGDSTAVFGELAANVHTTSGAWTWRGKAAYRGSKAENVKYFDSVAFTGEGEVAVSETAALYASAEVDFALDDDGNDDVPVYLGVGVLFRPSPTSQLGFGYQTVVGQDDLDIHSFNILGRVRF